MSFFAIEMIKEVKVTRHSVGGDCLFLEYKLLLVSTRLRIKVTLCFFFGPSMVEVGKDVIK